MEDHEIEEITVLLRRLTRDHTDVLTALHPDCCGRDPLAGDWERMDDEEYADYSFLFRAHLIDALGNLTDLGLEILRLEKEADDHLMEQIAAEAEMAEMDELDAACRR